MGRWKQRQQQQPIKATCSKEFKALKSSGSRLTSSIRWIVLHDEEASTAKSAAIWFANPESEGSAHLCVDDKECYRTLENTEIAWGAASSFGANSLGFHIEQAGFALWKSVVWGQHPTTLKRAAYKTALHLHEFRLPPIFINASGLLKGQKGVTTHAEVSKASRKQDPYNSPKYTHSDPGLFWPRRLFMRYVRQYYYELVV